MLLPIDGNNGIFIPTIKVSVDLEYFFFKLAIIV